MLIKSIKYCKAAGKSSYGVQHYVDEFSRMQERLRTQNRTIEFLEKQV
jgi:hypothetical protein